MYYTSNPISDANNYQASRDRADENLRNSLGKGFYNMIWGDYVPYEEAYEYAIDFFDGEEVTEEEVIERYFERPTSNWIRI